MKTTTQTDNEHDDKTADMLDEMRNETGVDLTPDEAILPAGCGAFDLTSYPFGGDFIRPNQDLMIGKVRPMESKPGWKIGECLHPTRKGTRTICSNQFKPSK